jgi:hypothetical protein
MSLLAIMLVRTDRRIDKAGLARLSLLACTLLPLSLPLSLSLTIFSGCTRANPAFRGVAEGGPPSDAQGDAPAEAPGDAGGDLRKDLPSDTTSDGVPTCVTAADCMTRNGAPICGVWECRPGGVCAVNCPNCTDGDGDGFGIGTGCADGDCDDADPAVHATDVRPCPAGAVNQGVCRSGSQSCTGGVWNNCTGQVTPSGEACNGEDDDCDGTPDDGLPTITCGLGACQNTVPSCSAGALATCVPHPAALDGDSTCDGIDDDCDGQIDEDCPAVINACVHVSKDGSDTGADGTITFPFQTIQAAINYAAVTPQSSKMVCVAGGRACADRTSYDAQDGSATGSFIMANGVSVYGNYESTSWTRCQLSPTAPDPTVTITLREALGVRFPATVITPTTLDGFVLERVNAATVAAVTVNGGRQVRLANLVVNDTPQAANSYGINLISGGTPVVGAEALITHCTIAGGAGSLETVGIRSVGSRPTIRENCSTFDSSGRCTATCADALGLGIAGRVTAGTEGTSTAILLDASPGASVETSTLCGAQGLQAVGVHMINDASGTIIRGNEISASAGVLDSLGVLAEDCGNAAPWIVGNSLIEGQGATRAVGVLSMGTCHPVIDGNAVISAGGDGTTNEADGVSCQTNANGEASLCAVLGNLLIQGPANFRPSLGVGVACKGKACARIAGNVVQGSAGGTVIGLWLRNNGTTVEQNSITGGCGQAATVGILAEDSFAHLQDNLVSGGTCAAAAGPTPLNVGLRVSNTNDQNEIIIHSNTIDGGGNGGACLSTAIEFGVASGTAAPVESKGILRNNILRGGACNTRRDFSEVSTVSDPRVFENNDLDPTGGSVLYRDENAAELGTAAAVNGLMDIISGNNIRANPMFASFPSDLHLGAGSACIGAGTPTGAPATDYDGKVRSALHPTIGAYE